jgi:hypothetical protein
LRKLSAAPKLATRPDNSLELTFKFEDGSSDEIVCPQEFATEFLEAVASLNKGQSDADEDHAVDLLEVSYEAGAGRVSIAVPDGQQTIKMVIGHEKAVGLGERLLHAAKKSTQSGTVPEFPVK